MLEKYQGCLLGVAVGDALGAPHEGFDISKRPTDEELNDPTIHEWQRDINACVAELWDNHNGIVTEMLPGLGFWAKGETTDDTAQTLCVVDSISTLGYFDMNDIVHRFVEWYDGGSGRGCGGLSGIALQLIEQGEDWSTAGQKAIDGGTVAYQGRNHASAYQVTPAPSNGSVMRTSPIGLYFAGQPKLIGQAARDLSLPTHAYLECIEACQVASQLIGRLALGDDKDEAINTTRSYVSPEVFDAYFRVPEQTFAHTGGAVTTLGIALAAFIENDNFEDTIVAAVNPQKWTAIQKWGENYGGPDTDTYAAVAGAFAGTLYGIEAVPSRWSDNIHPFTASEITQKATALYDVVQNR